MNPTGEFYHARFYPHGQTSWYGSFELGFQTPAPVSFYPLSATSTLLVAGQQGYVVDVIGRTGTPLDVFPVRQVVQVQGSDLWLVVDFNRVTAVGPSGFLWDSVALADDDLAIKECFPNAAIFVGWCSGESVVGGMRFNEHGLVGSPRTIPSSDLRGVEKLRRNFGSSMREWEV